MLSHLKANDGSIEVSRPMEAREKEGTEAVGLVAHDPARFVGQFQNKIDAKGRVSIPADLRRFIAMDGAEAAQVMYCFPSLLDDELQCGGSDLVETLLSIVATTDVFADNRYEFERLVTEETQRLYFDDNGRVVIPKALRDHAKLDGMIGFGGRGQYFAMAAAKPLEDVRAKARRLAKDNRETIRARSLTSTLAKRGEAP